MNEKLYAQDDEPTPPLGGPVPDDPDPEDEDDEDEDE